MRPLERLHCEKCGILRLHRPEGESAAKCDECGTIRDASFEFAPLSLMEHHRASFVRHRIRTGQLTEWPGQPGVWS